MGTTATPPRARTRTRRMAPATVAPPSPAVGPPLPRETVHPVEEHLSRYLRRRWSVRDEDTVVLGWSGSAGSTALLCALASCAAGVGPRVRVVAVFVRDPRPSVAARRLEGRGRAIADRLGVAFRVVDAPAAGEHALPGERVHGVLRAVSEEFAAPVALLGRTRENRILEILHRVLEEGALEEFADGPAGEEGPGSRTRPLAAPFVEIDGASVLRYASERAPEADGFRESGTGGAHPARARLKDRILPAILEEYPYADTCILRLEQIARQASRLLARRALRERAG